MSEDLFRLELDALTAENQAVVDLIAEVRESRAARAWARRSLAAAQARVAALEAALLDMGQAWNEWARYGGENLDPLAAAAQQALAVLGRADWESPD